MGQRRKAQDTRDKGGDNFLLQIETWLISKPTSSPLVKVYSILLVNIQNISICSFLNCNSSTVLAKSTVEHVHSLAVLNIVLLPTFYTFAVQIPNLTKMVNMWMATLGLRQLT